MRMQLPMATAGPIIILGSSADAVGRAHWGAQLRLPMATSGPIILSGSAAGGAGWAHHICACSCQWLQLGLLIFYEVLPMQ